MIDTVDLIMTFLYIITLFYTIFWLITILEESGSEKKPKLNTINAPNTPDSLTLSVAVPAYNEEDTIVKTIQSVADLDYDKENVEIIVINDGSTDSTEEKVKAFIGENPGLNIRLISQKNSGKWYALNQAMKMAKGEFFACLDADSFVEKDALKKMLPYFQEENVAAVLPLLKVKETKNLLQKIQWYEYLVNMFYKKLLSFLNCIHVTPGPFSIYRKSVIQKLGGFKKGHCTEDLEMALRLQKNQYLIIQLMDAEVYTYSPKNIKALYYQRNRWNKGSILNVWDYKGMMFNKEYGDFGMFQMPIILSTGFIALILVSFIIYRMLLKPFFITIRNLSLINFDVFTFLRDFKLNLIPLDVDYYKAVIMVVMFIISITVLVIAHRYTRERIIKQGIMPLVAFLFLYYIFLGFVWCGIVKDLILRKKEQW